MAGRDVVAELSVNLTLETASFASGASVAEARAKTMEGRLQRLGTVAKGAGNQVAGMATGFLTGLGTAAVAGLGAAAVASLDYASSLGETAQQLGVTTKELQSYRYAATQAGIEQGTMDQSLAKLTKNLGEAASGTGPAAAAFERLGISTRNADGSFKTAGQAIPEIAEKLKGIANPAERAAILTDLFGKSGQKLLPLLSDGAKGVNELAGAAEKLGIIISDEQIAKADEAADKLAAYKQVLGAKIAIGTVTGLDALTAAGDFLDRWAAGSNAAVKSFVDSTRIGFENVGKVVGFLKNVFTGLPAAVGGALANMLGQVSAQLGAKFTSIIEGAKAKVEQLRQTFFNLWDRVTRRSYVPDMVDDISREMDRLGPDMVDKAAKATAAAGGKFKTLRDEVNALMGELFPEIERALEQGVKLDTIIKGLKGGILNDDQAADATRRLWGAQDIMPTGVGAPTPEELDISEDVERLKEQFEVLGDGAGKLSEKWEGAAQAIVGLVQGLFGGSKTGRLFGALLQGGLGIAKAFGGFRANGGPVVPGKHYVVGENGPEYFSPGRRGMITPANDGGGFGRIQIVPSPYFNAVVDSRASNVAAPLAGRAAMTGAAGGMAGVARQKQRAIP
ncbi:hypothetical protein GGQ97_002305 [Sphingomonas kaistensis]|uniref:Phage tail tape measure protein domain-containing protein n=1 Tax=Sphingomonas kaistensis TaxID=298708 RepID=A0A7X5Y8I6_9SPHN|nr:phage tail tape measure protein [Sphingomonas kaistensis]NJC06512.1 hypothetical protein [Sphingomonas kaistensis]